MYKIQTFYRTGQTSTLPCVTLEGSLFVHLRGGYRRVNNASSSFRVSVHCYYISILLGHLLVEIGTEVEKLCISLIFFVQSNIG